MQGLRDRGSNKDRMSEDTVILACPFCGGPARVEEQDVRVFGAHRYAVYCTGYYCGGTTALCTLPDIAIKYWNRRDKPKE